LHRPDPAAAGSDRVTGPLADHFAIDAKLAMLVAAAAAAAAFIAITWIRSKITTDPEEEPMNDKPKDRAQGLRNIEAAAKLVDTRHARHEDKVNEEARAAFAARESRRLALPERLGHLLDHLMAAGVADPDEFEDGYTPEPDLREIPETNPPQFVISVWHEGLLYTEELPHEGAAAGTLLYVERQLGGHNEWAIVSDDDGSPGQWHEGPSFN
jgi:hypothetical protein